MLQKSIYCRGDFGRFRPFFERLEVRDWIEKPGSDAYVRTEEHPPSTSFYVIYSNGAYIHEKT